MLSGMNSPSLLMLVKEPFLATCCRASGMYPGGGELRSVEWEPDRTAVIESEKIVLCAPQSQLNHVMLIFAQKSQSFMHRDSQFKISKKIFFF